MDQMVNNPEMVTEPPKMVKISQRNYERLQRFGFAGESLNTALDRALDLAEKKKENSR
jgi:hypothetical protein